jgi:hypothetical protein
MKSMVSKKYKQRGKDNRIKRLGGWGAMVERQITSTLAREISDEIDREILRRLKTIAENG